MSRIEWPAIIDRAAAIVRSYDTSVTLRQLFYQLVSAQLLPNTVARHGELVQVDSTLWTRTTCGRSTRRPSTATGTCPRMSPCSPGSAGISSASAMCGGHVMTGDMGIRRMAAAAVLLVAAIAAVISFVHIERLAAAHGQSALAAYLLPLSIDGTVAAASLAMLRAARAGLGTPHLARVMLGLAVTATLASNVAYGARFGLTGSLLSGWPAVAFIGSAEIAIGMTRRARQAAPVPAAVPEIRERAHGYEDRNQSRTRGCTCCTRGCTRSGPYPLPDPG